jgi:hypothetical protein
VERDGDIVGGADFLGADAPFVEEARQRRRQELEDGGAGAADVAAVAGAALRLAQRALEAGEAFVVLVGAAAVSAAALGRSRTATRG